MEEMVTKMEEKNFWQDRNVFVTGATGFLGSWLTGALVDKGANVTCLVRDIVPKSMLVTTGTIKKVNVANGDIVDYNCIRRIFADYMIDTCFHLAAQPIVSIAIENPLDTFEINIKGTWNVLEAARNSATLERMVLASSDKAYGTHSKLPYTEDFSLQGVYPYDASKSCCDLLATTYFKTYKLPVCITRCGNLYGGGDLNFNRIIPDTIRSLIMNRVPIIRSDGTFIRDYFYVRDAVDAYLCLAENMDNPRIVGEAFNFGTEDHLKALDLVNKIISAFRRDTEPIILNEAANEIRDQYLSCEKAKELLGWEAKWGIDKGLKETIEWYVDFFKTD